MMHRYRFFIPGDDSRPMTFPPPDGVGPYWETGFNDLGCIVVAYAKDEATITSAEAWPDAENIDDGGPKDFIFTDRFPEPEWWSEKRKATLNELADPGQEFDNS